MGFENGLAPVDTVPPGKIPIADPAFSRRSASFRVLIFDVKDFLVLSKNMGKTNGVSCGAFRNT